MRPTRVFAMVVVLAAIASTFRSALAFETLGKAWRNSRATYRINPRFPDTDLTGTSDQQILMLRAAADAWRNQSRGEFEFAYEGTTTRSTVNLGDSVNLVTWIDDDDEDALAVTFLRFDSRDRVAGFDIIFFDSTDGEKNNWNGPRDPESGTLDLMGVAVHEFGHALGLDHSSIHEATMFDAITNRGVHLRTLDDDDVAGMHFLYGEDRADADTLTRLESVTPDGGPGLGGNEVVITGTNFTWTANTTLMIDGTEVPREFWEVESLGLIRILAMPEHGAGFATLSIQNSLGLGSLPDAYRYGPPLPGLQGVEPAIGPLAGGIRVSIFGRNLSPDGQVTIGGEPLIDPEFVDSGSIAGFLPPGSGAGLVEIVLTQGIDMIRLDGGFSYTALVLRVDHVKLHPGSIAQPVEVRATTDRVLSAISFGLVHESPDLALEDITVEGTVAAGAAFAVANIDNVAGVTTFGIVMDFLDTEPNIAPGEDEVVAVLLASIDEAAEPGLKIDLTLAGGVGQPPIELFFTPVNTAQKLDPFTIDGTITVVEATFLRGDANEDGELNLADVIFHLDALFRGGPGSLCQDAADANDDGQLDISDAVSLLGFLFLGEAPPPAPHPDPGMDPTADELGC